MAPLYIPPGGIEQMGLDAALRPQTPAHSNPCCSPLISPHPSSLVKSKAIRGWPVAEPGEGVGCLAKDASAQSVQLEGESSDRSSLARNSRYRAGK